MGLNDPLTLGRDNDNVVDNVMFSKLKRRFVPDGSSFPEGGAGSAGVAADGCERLEIRDADIPEAELMSILDRHPHAAAVHAAMIQRPNLPEAVIVRLAALLRPALIDTLVSRHPLPEMLRRDIAKRRRDRPDWWSRALFDRMR